ncbi:MAG TPA: cytochrome P450 [Streptosporangiaceae bacterium]|nr:cytochrome P450 [Streptosporangiaceae bacterium]
MTESVPEAFPFPLEPADLGTPTRLYGPDRCPVSQIRLPSGDLAYFVLGYDDVETVLKDRRFSRNFRYPGAPRMVKETDLSSNPDAIVNLDPPEHTRLRRIIAGSFRPRHAAAWRPVIQKIVDGLLDDVTAGGPPADLAAGFAELLPISVMCELLDIPPEDKPNLIDWTGIFFDTSSASTSDRTQAGIAFITYVRNLVAARRVTPGAGIVDELIAACDAEGALTPAELYQMISALFIGGQENTSAVLARGILALLRERERWEELVADPGLIEPAVEEILRYEVMSEGAFLRVTTTDVDLTGGSIPGGCAVQVSIPSANRDAKIFASPDTFDLHRTTNPHLTFGIGAHFCPGAALARLELQIALSTLVTRFPGLRLAIAPDEVRYAQDTLVRALLALPVTW